MLDEDQQRQGEEFKARKTRLPGKILKPLQELSPLRSTFSLFQTWGLAVGLFVLAYWSQHPLVLVLCIFGMSAQQHALAILTHQSAHYRMYRTRWLNDLVGKICGYSIFASMQTYRIIHRLHHNRLWSIVDPDLALVAGYPRGRGYLLRKLGKDLLGLTTLKNYAYFFGQSSGSESDRSAHKALDDTSPRMKLSAAKDRKLMVAVQLVIWALLAWFGLWKFALLLWALPLVTLTQGLLRLRAVCEHGAAPDHDNPLRAARTNLSPLWIRWWLFPHNMHYHIEHHLYPGVPHYRLRDCHRAMKKEGMLEEAEVMSVFTCFAKIFAPVP